MRQTYWHLTGNLWALALSTVIALFLPYFGPEGVMGNGVGVVIRTTIIVPAVFTAMFLTGLLIANLAKRWRFMSILMAGIERGIEKAAEERAAQRVAAAEKNAAEASAAAAAAAAAASTAAAASAATAASAAATAASAAAAASAEASAAAAQVVTEELRNRGFSEADIAAIVRRITRQD